MATLDKETPPVNIDDGDIAEQRRIMAKSEAEWGQEDGPHKFNQIFSPIDEDDLDILTPLTTCELMTSFNKENDSEETCDMSMEDVQSNEDYEPRSHRQIELVHDDPSALGLGHCFECNHDDSTVSKIYLIFEFAPYKSLRDRISAFLGIENSSCNWSSIFAHWDIAWTVFKLSEDNRYSDG
ncbi:hypothetical protein K1719_004156 [Acacia pycnantha]|nr:hypothetical protein K1719_004156 [Acacia pycnantha]